MFFAIINDSYAKVKEENAQALPDFEFSDFLKLKYSQIVDKLNMKHDRLADIQTVILTVDLKIKNGVDFVTWRQELRVIFLINNLHLNFIIELKFDLFNI